MAQTTTPPKAQGPGVLIVAGPTCSGKTELALDLAERFGAEIVSADSRQIYRGMPIGTAAPSARQQARVPHHLVGFLDPTERYSAARFAADALAAIVAIHARGKRALVAGGTGFYVRALCGDVATSAAYDPSLRARLAREAQLHPTAVLHAWLEARDPRRAAAIAPSDPYRILRALEIALGPRPAQDCVPASLRSVKLAYLKVALQPDPAELDARIEARTKAMLTAGFIEEAERIGAAAVAADAVGYPFALAYLAGQTTLDELRSLMIRATRRYAKRQLTWYRAEPGAWHVPSNAAFGAIASAARERLAWS